MTVMPVAGGHKAPRAPLRQASAQAGITSHTCNRGLFQFAQQAVGEHCSHRESKSKE